MSTAPQSIKVIRSDGTQTWLLSDYIHRDDGPAVIQPNGTELWYQHGLLHRADGPAVTTSNGSWYWYCHGRRHRMDGPAVVYTSGWTFWWVWGNCIHTKEEYQRLTKLSDEDMMLLVLKYGELY